MDNAFLLFSKLIMAITKIKISIIVLRCWVPIIIFCEQAHGRWSTTTTVICEKQTTTITCQRSM